MPFIAAVTQPSWIAVLREVGCDGEVNFWRPGTASLAKEHLGGPFVFVQKGHEPRKVAGLGTVVRFEIHPLNEAWRLWGTRNGVLTLEEFRARMNTVARGTASNSGGTLSTEVDVNTPVGCVVLRHVTLFPPGGEPTTEQVFVDSTTGAFKKNTVSYQVFQADVPELLLRLGYQRSRTNRLGQAPNIDEEEKRAIELHAVQVCRSLFAGWVIRDVSSSEQAVELLGQPYPGYDLVADGRSIQLHIEVKGTKAPRPVVRLSDNELRTASQDPQARLCVVSGVRTFKVNGRWKAAGGAASLYSWRGLESVRSAIEVAERKGLTLCEGTWAVDADQTQFLTRMGLTRSGSREKQRATE